MPSERFARLFREEHGLLRVAARESLERIRADLRQAPPRVQQLLEYLEDHLFDQGLNVKRAKVVCGIGDNSIALRFHAHVGEAPKAYFSERRLETAAKLLRESNLKIWQIAELTGYSSLAVFGKAFGRWMGERPGAYRKQQADATSDGAAGDLTTDDQFLQAALAGALSNRQAQALIERLLVRYPQRARSVRVQQRAMAASP